MDKFEELEDMIRNNGSFTPEYENKALNCLGEIACNFRNLDLDNDRKKELIEGIKHKTEQLNYELKRLRRCIEVLIHPEEHEMYR